MRSMHGVSWAAIKLSLLQQMRTLARCPLELVEHSEGPTFWQHIAPNAGMDGQEGRGLLVARPELGLCVWQLRLPPLGLRGCVAAAACA